MTSYQRRSYYRQYLVLLNQSEAKNYRLVRGVLRTWLGRVFSALDTHTVEAVTAQLPTLIHSQPLEDAFLRLYTQTGVAFAKNQFQSLASTQTDGALPKEKRESPALDVGFYSARWVEGMRKFLSEESSTRIVNITDLTRQKTRDVLEEAATNRLNVKQTARLLTEKTGGAILKRRAVLITRTETTTAANHGLYLGAQSTSLTLDKEWIATRDGRTRDNHRQADGQTVGRDENFTVGGIPMLYPGDPKGGAANVCNCRCIAAYIPAKRQLVQPQSPLSGLIEAVTYALSTQL